MIKVSVMYPNEPGARFDHDYYRDKHMPLLKQRMGDACRYYTIDKGLAGGAPGEPPTYVGMCHIFADSVEAFQAAFGPHAKEIMGDIPNYTDLKPTMQISEVVVEEDWTITVMTVPDAIPVTGPRPIAVCRTFLA